MEKRRLNDAAYDVFNFFRHEYCDWYLEAIKPRLRDETAREPALAVAVLILGVTYKLLHPVMPFITEELWSWLPSSEGFLMTSSFMTSRHVAISHFVQAAAAAARTALSGELSLRWWYEGIDWAAQVIAISVALVP